MFAQRRPLPGPLARPRRGLAPRRPRQESGDRCGDSDTRAPTSKGIHRSASVGSDHPAIRGAVIAFVEEGIVRRLHAGLLLLGEGESRQGPTGTDMLTSAFAEKGPPSQCSRFGVCLVGFRGPGSSIPAHTLTFGRGSRPTRRAWTTWTGCAGPMASTVPCAVGRRRGSCLMAAGPVGCAAGGCPRLRARSFTGRGPH